MAQQTINIGAAANDGTGDPARTAFGKVNDNFTELYAQSGHGVIGSTVTTKQDDYAPDGWSACRTLRWNGAGSTGVTGFDSTDIPDGAERIITNASTDYLLWLENENTASSAANRMALPKGFPAFLMPGDSLTLQYDTTAARWRVIDWPNQGQAMGLTVFDDCDVATGAPYAARASGTGASIQVSGTGAGSPVQNVGQVQLETGTGSTNHAGKQLASGSVWIAPTLGAAMQVTRSYPSSPPSGAETYIYGAGFQDLSTGALTNAVMWELRYDGANATYSKTVAAAGVITRNSDNVPASNVGWVWLAVFVNPAWTRADYLYSTNGINFVLSGSHSSGLPGVANMIGPGATIMKTAGTANRIIVIDLLGHRFNQVRKGSS